jgi:glycosyltransferase involved in cell wall biosynthesis
MIGTRGLPASDGGVEIAVEALSRELVKRGHRVTVYGRRGYCDPHLRLHEGIRQIPLPQINTKHLEAISHTALATSHALISGGNDLVHFHATGPSLLSWLPHLKRIPSVVTIQGMDWKREKWGASARNVLRFAARVASTVPDETIVVSRVLQQQLTKSYGREFHYVPNGVDLTGMTEAQPVEGLGDRPFALFLGRIVPEKQVHLLIEAFSRLQGDFQLAIAGSSSHSDEYVQTVRRLAAADQRVVLLGSRYGAEKAWLLKNSTVFVQPSTIEGLPIALLEALACDCFTIVSDIPENVEAVTLRDDAPYGLVFRTGDVEDLALKLGQALQPGSRLVADTPRAGKLVRERYDWERIAEQTENVYRGALARCDSESLSI